jgi:hypothetical protein
VICRRSRLCKQIAGQESTAHMTALSVLTLLRHNEQRAALQADPGKIPDAVEDEVQVALETLFRHQMAVYGVFELPVAWS